MIFDVDVSDAWRVFNALLALTAFALVLRAVLRKWRRYTTRMRLLAQSLLVYLAATIVGAVENIAQDNPAGFRTAMVTAACAWCIYAIAGTSEGYERADRR